MNVDHLNDGGVESIFHSICTELDSALDIDSKRELLERFVILFDELNSDDFFGTEGWKHFCRIS